MTLEKVLEAIRAFHSDTSRSPEEMSEPEENTEHIFQDLQGLPDAILKDPDEWLFGEHTAKHKSSGLEIWTANVPLWDMEVWRPFKVSIPFLVRLRVCKAFRKLKRDRAIRMVQKT